MKLLHTADLHQGILTHSRPDPATGIPSRILDVANAWAKVVDVALEENVDAVILAGDVFHTASPDATTLALFAAPLRRLIEDGIDVVIIPGNHDRAPHSGCRSVLESFHEAGGSRAFVHVATTPKIVEAWNGLSIACLPSVSRAELAAYYDGDRFFHEETAVEILRGMVNELGADGADVLTLHTSIAGGVLGSEKDLAIIAEPMLLPADLAGPWSYVAAGHIHRPQTIGEDGAPPPAIRYSGSIAPLTFGEEGDHGVSVVEFEEGWSAGRHVPIESRPLFSLEWNADLLGAPGGVEVPSFEVLEGAIVRVTDVPVDAIDDTRQSLEAEGAWIVKIEPERADRPVDTLGTEEVPSTRDALEAWLEPRVPDQDERQRVVELASEL